MKFVAKNAVVFSAGELCNLEAGEADGAATGDAALIGAAVEDVDNTNDGEQVAVIINPNAIYAVDDANARSAGDVLDIASGGLGVTSPTNNDLIVVMDSGADEPTYVTFNVGKHYLR